MKPWDYAETLSQREKLHISYPKADTGTKNNICWICLQIMYVHAPCTYAVYVLYVCILCMHYMYAFFVLYVRILYILCKHSMYASMTVCISYNYRKTEAKRIIKKTKKMRLDALIIFLIEWRHKVLISRGKQAKY